MKRKYCLTPSVSQTGMTSANIPKVTDCLQDLHLDRDAHARRIGTREDSSTNAFGGGGGGGGGGAMDCRQKTVETGKRAASPRGATPSSAVSCGNTGAASTSPRTSTSLPSADLRGTAAVHHYQHHHHHQQQHSQCSPPGTPSKRQYHHKQALHLDIPAPGSAQRVLPGEPRSADTCRDPRGDRHGHHHHHHHHQQVYQRRPHHHPHPHQHAHHPATRDLNTDIWNPDPLNIMPASAPIRTQPPAFGEATQPGCMAPARPPPDGIPMSAPLCTGGYLDQTPPVARGTAAAGGRARRAPRQSSWDSGRESVDMPPGSGGGAAGVDRGRGTGAGVPPSASGDDGVFSFDEEEFDTAWTFHAQSLTKDDFEPMLRPRSSTITPGEDINSRKLPTVFRWEGGGKEVWIAGSFDNWKSKIPMVKSHGDFSTIVELPEGSHQYKFYVDGHWVCDTNQPQMDNDLGSKNNKVNVKASDFEVFEALAMDSGTPGQTLNDSGSLSGSPPGEYTQYIPPRNTGQGFHHSGPPILPPHLLQVILNKETSQHCEPTLLPEPNHVMLNHLYALSIKDGVMVLSATHRYRKKYVTTLLYKPI